MSRSSFTLTSRFYLVNVVLPVASIVLASASSLAVSHDTGGRLSATLTLLLTAVAYKYIVSEMVPKISYNTLLDWYVLVCWAFLLLMVLENCFIKHSQGEICVIFGFSAQIGFKMIGLRIIGPYTAKDYLYNSFCSLIPF